MGYGHGTREVFALSLFSGTDPPGLTGGLIRHLQDTPKPLQRNIIQSALVIQVGLNQNLILIKREFK
jgi:hypothetical protein